MAFYKYVFKKYNNNILDLIQAILMVSLEYLLYRPKHKAGKVPVHAPYLYSNENDCVHKAASHFIAS